ncbi:PfaD family polyunsaturated fatty acid/polyketide biosynthesis protein [Spirillospora sp. NPDC050679]
MLPEEVAFSGPALVELAARIRQPVRVVGPVDGHRGMGLTTRSATGAPTVAVLPPLLPEDLGDRGFREDHRVAYAYVAGEMAGGIATTRMVKEMARADSLAFFGAGGLAPARVAAAVDELAAELRDRPNWGVNLIHSPAERATEDAVAGVLLERGVPIVSASAFMELTPAVVRVAARGLDVDRQGRVRRRTRLFAKVSRPEVAAGFLEPAPGDVLAHLVAHGELSPREAELAGRVPVAEALTVEADSGGHTDNRPLTVLLPAMLALRDQMAGRHRYDRPVHVGAAGGLGTPGAVAGAFALGAAYVVTGSVNQAAVESGLSAEGKELLAAAGLADVAMAPAADMFELGVKLQVLKRGTMFAARAGRLHQVYSEHASWEQVPAAMRQRIERDILRDSFDRVWAETRRFWLEREPAQAERGEHDPRHRMALVFRWYLGMSSRWAVHGEPGRRADYQIWCGPAMGAFNQWTAGGFLADPEQRTVVQIALNLMEGAAVLTRAHQLRSLGVRLPPESFAFAARPLAPRPPLRQQVPA